jgi:E3 ubiquitin-protein ligase MARCH6
MIEQPVTRHIHRMIASMLLFFSIIMLAVYFPLQIIKWYYPSTLPWPCDVFNIDFTELEQLLLQVSFIFLLSL